MAQVEVGEFFVVSRGFQLGEGLDLSYIFSDGMSLDPTPKKDKPPEYDRSHEGLIYYAGEVCGPMIAAVLVHNDGRDRLHPIGQRVSINTNEVEVWPVTEKYAKTMRISLTVPDLN